MGLLQPSHRSAPHQRVPPMKLFLVGESVLEFRVLAARLTAQPGTKISKRNFYEGTAHPVLKPLSTVTVDRASFDVFDGAAMARSAWYLDFRAITDGMDGSAAVLLRPQNLKEPTPSLLRIARARFV